MAPSTFPRCDLLDYADYEDHHDATVNQMLIPRSHQEDATIVLNNLLKEYDKTLRPDIGGEAGGEPGGPQPGSPSECGAHSRCLHTAEFFTIWMPRLFSGHPPPLPRERRKGQGLV